MLMFMGRSADLAGYALGQRLAALDACARACQAASWDCQARLQARSRRADDLARISLLAEDCRGLCDLLSTLLTRRSPLVPEASRACLEGCLACARSCEPYPDAPLLLCAEKCRACAELCLPMAHPDF